MKNIHGLIAIVIVVMVVYTIEHFYPAFPAIGVGVALGYVIGKQVKDKD